MTTFPDIVATLIAAYPKDGEAAIDAAFKSLQDLMGVPEGDVAAVWYGASEKRLIHRACLEKDTKLLFWMFREYLGYERSQSDRKFEAVMRQVNVNWDSKWSGY